METVDYELLRFIGYARSCGFMLVVLFVAISAAVAGVRLKKVVGVWVFSVAMFLFFGVEAVSTLLDLAELDVDVMSWFYALTSIVTLLLSAAMLVGVALLEPPPASGSEETS